MNRMGLPIFVSPEQQEEVDRLAAIKQVEDEERIERLYRAMQEARAERIRSDRTRTTGDRQAGGDGNLRGSRVSAMAAQDLIGRPPGVDRSSTTTDGSETRASGLTVRAQAAESEGRAEYTLFQVQNRDAINQRAQNDMGQLRDEMGQLRQAPLRSAQRTEGVNSLPQPAPNRPPGSGRRPAFSRRQEQQRPAERPRIYQHPNRPPLPIQEDPDDSEFIDSEEEMMWNLENEEF